MENISLGFLLMLVGMSTVFFIPLIVIGLGKLLILIVNRYWPEQSLLPAATSPAPKPSSAQSVIPESVIVAIVSAVGIATEGKAKVKSIKKNDEK